MHDNGASSENAPKSHTVTPQPQPQPKPAECGNGIIESGEQCDGALLGGHSCADRYGSNAKGDVGCDPTTCKVKYDNCEPTKRYEGDLRFFMCGIKVLLRLCLTSMDIAFAPDVGKYRLIACGL